MSDILTTGEQIRNAFDEMVAQKRAVLSRPQAELAASRQILRDIQAGEIEKAAGIEFLIEQEVAYGHSRERAQAHFKMILEGRMSDWPPRSMEGRQGR